MIEKVLVANRGEIAVRAFRAAYELGIVSAAVYTPDDRGSQHRIKADESYEIGDPGHPVQAYLDPEAMVAKAAEIGADAIYPGYGFMSENPELARRCAQAGITFVGPPADVLAMTGNKVRAREAAERSGVPVLAATPLLTDADEAVRLAGDIGFPLFVKAAAGGGGRGMRLVRNAESLAESVEVAMREAEGAFGDPSVYLERALMHARHIEVQILADGQGNVVHLFERDCSVQRRHQKIVELAPAPNFDPTLRQALCDAAVAFAREIGYVNAGTVEFLVDVERGDFVFIEMNPRIQVEHTVTEETTDVDLVRSQLLIAGGASLDELGLSQDTIRQRGFALQCRITTEDPAADFRPDTGRISAYRAPGGAGIRIDEGSAYVGADVSPYFDSLLLKVTARAADFPTAIARARRAVAEVRVRGVTTNQTFVSAILQDADFQAGLTYTTFVEDRPGLTEAPVRADRASKLLVALAENTVNRPHGPAPTELDPQAKLPVGALSASKLIPGSRERLAQLGPAGFARWLRGEHALQLTDTTMRDAHQSLLATRMRTYDILAAAPYVARMLPGLLSLEVWGGATYDVALRFLGEDPWERLAAIRTAAPNICLQMLLRGQNLLGYEPYDDRVVRAFVAEAHSAGIDIFRIFDALNNIAPMRVAIDAAVDAGALVEGAVCYTSDLSDPAEQLYTLDYYVRVAQELVEYGVHTLVIKDMAGLLRAPAAEQLIGRLRSEFDVPVRLHTHDTAGGQLATYMAALRAGVDGVDGAVAPLAGLTSQPSLASIVAATDHTPQRTGISLDALLDLEPYWEQVRAIYAPFEAGPRAPTGRVYRHEIPGGQLSNLRQQAVAVGVGDRFEEVEAAYEQANQLLGDIIKVTPSSKVVGDLALWGVSNAVDWDDLRVDPQRYDLPASVIGFLRGELGVPAGGLPQPFAERALRGLPAPAAAQVPEQALAALETPGEARRRALSEIMFPGPQADFEKALGRYGDLSVLPTRLYLYGLEAGREETVQLEPGVELLVELEAIGEADTRGMRTVLTKLNGQLRPIEVRDLSVASTAAEIERADPGNPDHVGAPLTGVVTLRVSVGDEVTQGQPIAILEAMKMESTITAPRDGRVAAVAARTGQRLEQGDLILRLEP